MDASSQPNSEAPPPADEPPLASRTQSPQRRQGSHRSSPAPIVPAIPRGPINRTPPSVVNTGPAAVVAPSSAPQEAVATQPAATTATTQPEAPVSGGQDHDRMETDDETTSSSGTHTPNHSDAANDSGQPAPVAEPEAMDTSPDQPAVPVQTGGAQALNASAQSTFRIDMSAMIGVTPTGLATVVGNPSLQFNVNGEDLPPFRFSMTAANGNPAQQPLGAQQPVPPPQRDDSTNVGSRRERRERDREHRNEDENMDGESEDSSGDEENPYWASFKEDTSSPDEAQLRAIEEEEKDKPTALDHEHWSKLTGEVLEDPEYIPGDQGRITWTVKGVHGTPENPTRERMMRSPSKKIGDMYWSIKFYPRGNNDSDNASVYVECSPTRYEDEESTETVRAGTPEVIDDGITMASSVTSPSSAAEESVREDRGTFIPTGGLIPGVPIPGRERPPQARPPPPQGGPPTNSMSNGDGPVETPASAQSTGPVTGQEAPTASEVPAADPLASSQTLPAQAAPNQLGGHTVEPPTVIERPWRVAAQVCCVMYNPDEPRVYKDQKSNHQYNNDSSDWGWTRFEGPWHELHERKPKQRQALLRNDTLAFSVYIYTVKDDTNALWWHAPKEKPVWDSLEMTGVPALKCSQPDQAGALIAALSTWFHLTPFLKLVTEAFIPDGYSDPDGPRPRPMIEELRAMVLDPAESILTDRELDLSLVASMMDGHSRDGIKRMDVIALWEHLRRIVTYEMSNQDTVKQACAACPSLFEDLLVLKQPDPFQLDEVSRMWRPSFPGSQPAHLRADHEPRSVQETIESASQNVERQLRVWESFPSYDQQVKHQPPVIQIELHRQHFDQKNRKWIKLGHKITLDEMVYFHGVGYTLCGMIVHSGSLGSQEYYSLIRPRGSDTRWFKYSAANNSKRVAILTDKQAVDAHEGSGEPVLEKKDANSKVENAAVAYIVTYVLWDEVEKQLQCPLERFAGPLDRFGDPTTGDAGSAPKDEVEMVDAPVEDADRTSETVPVWVYAGDVFSGPAGLGIFDPWHRRVREQCQDKACIHPAESVKIGELRDLFNFLLPQPNGEGEERKVQFWLLDSREPTEDPLPKFHTPKNRDDESLEQCGFFAEGCRIWLGGQELELIREVLRALRESDLEELFNQLRMRTSSAGADDTPTQPSNQTDQADANSLESRISFPPVPPTNVSFEGREQLISEIAARVIEHAQSPPPTNGDSEQSQAPVQSEPSNGNNEQPQEQVQPAASSGDNEEPVQEQAQDESPPEAPKSDDSNSILVFLKRFNPFSDPEGGILTRLGSMTVNPKDNVFSRIGGARFKQLCTGQYPIDIGDDIWPPSGWENSNNDWEVYLEPGYYSKTLRQVDVSEKFSFIQSTSTTSPTDPPPCSLLLIVAERPNAEQ